ncbi:hypothetical protein LOD99_16111 [Oopsacas minuta]|uniref:Uncharacterized protein n=1 Tax=Oopsacas minuta TaxID=111878 RepID=A0AAV7K6T2_9METZ|nr:hypothetical protein LOD99_16111 [Oopsacas minuta]
MSINKRSSICLKQSVSRAEGEINQKLDEIVSSVEEMRSTLLKELKFKEEQVMYNSVSHIRDLETLRRHKVQTEELFRDNRQQELLKDNMHMLEQQIQDISDDLKTREIKISWQIEEFQKALRNIATISSDEPGKEPPPVPPRRERENSITSIAIVLPNKIPERHSSNSKMPHRVVRIDENETDDKDEDYMAMTSSQSMSESHKNTNFNRSSSSEKSPVSGRARWNTLSCSSTGTGARKPFDPLPSVSHEMTPALPPKTTAPRRSSHTSARLPPEKILGIKIERVNPIFAGCNKGKDPEELNKPSSVDIDISTSNIYVADTYNHCIKVYDRNGKYKFLFGRKSPGKVAYPFGLCISSRTVYVGEKMDGKIKAFDLNGTFLREVTGDGTKKGNYKFIWGITADDENGDIYACDNEGDRIQTYNSNLEFKYTVIGEGKPGNVVRPVDVKVRDHMIIVLDQGNPCVHYFDKQGVPLWSMVRFEQGETAIAPQCFTFDLEDNILITDANTHTIRIYTPKGELYIALGRKGDNRGEFFSPTGIALDTNGNIVSISQRDRANLQIISYQQVTITK